MTTHYQDLEEQIEYWRQRAESAEAAICGARWNDAVPPLTLYQTRLMRLLARKAFTPEALALAMSLDYPETSKRCVYIQIFHVRNKLPWQIAPSPARKYSHPYDVPDRDALRAFLAGEAIEQRRAA